MRIVYLSGHYPPDFSSGATLQVQRLAAAALRAGHEVKVIAGAHRSGLADGQTRDEVVDGIGVTWIGNGGWTDQDLDENWWNPTAAAVVARCLDSWRPDVVHAHALQTLGADSLLAASTRGIRTVVTMHDFWWVCARLFLVDRRLRPCPVVPETGCCDCARSIGWRRDRERRLREVLDRVDLVLAPSQGVVDTLAANGISALLDPNDVDLTGLPRAMTSSGHDVGTGDVRFLYIGGPNPLKGAEVVLRATDRLRTSTGWHLTAHGLEGRAAPPVRIAPPFDPDDRGAVLREADVLLLPSIARESFSLAAREALHAGLAVVTSDCLGPEEVVEHGVNGLVVPTGDDQALADAMRLLVEDRDLLARLQRGAGSTRVAALDADQHLAALLPHYLSTTLPHPVQRPVEARRPTPRVRIVVVNHRTRDLTLRCLEHIDALTYPRDRYEVVIVDNDSGDGLVETLHLERPDVTVVANRDNRGFGAGCNAGIALPGDWDAVALLNNDSVPHPDWLDELVTTWWRPPVTDGPIGAVAGKVLLAGSGLVNSAGCDLRRGGFNADRGDGRADDGSFDAPCEVFGWSGASVLLTRAMLDDIGGFDESFFLYYEDVDMVWRGRRRGWAVVYAPAAVSVHDRGSSVGRGDVHAFHDTRNRLLVLARHAPLSWLLRAIAIQMRLVVTGGPPSKPRSMRLRALGSLLVRLPRLARERRHLGGRATVGLDRVIAWQQD